METATQRLHRITSYGPDRDWDEAFDHTMAVRDFESNDLDRLPWFYKRYRDELERRPLPRELPVTAAGTGAILAGTAEVARRELGLDHLARLLYLSAGVVRTMRRPYGDFLFRAAGSAGGRFPLELYVCIPDGTGLPPGIHWYHPQDHALLRVGPAPGSGAPTLVLTGVPWRTGWRYRERGYRHLYWDAGTMLSHTLATAVSAGIVPHLYTRFPDAAVAKLVGADGIHEFPLAVVALGEADPILEGARPGEPGEVDGDPIAFPLITDAQRAGDGDDLGAPWDLGAPVEMHGGEQPVETTILGRGSQRRMDPGKGVAGSLMTSSLAAALRGIDISHRVVVHDVNGFEPGVYAWPDLEHPVRRGDFRDELYRICLEQDLARDAAFVVMGVARVGELSDRSYREAQLAAGLVSGRLHLLAYSQGAGASGMTFEDGAIAPLLGEEIDALLFTCIGVPEYEGAIGGPPGRPTEVRRVEPRIKDAR